jgi:hypothetical protein
MAVNKILKLEQLTIELLNSEFDGIPEKYQKFFNSTHEGYGVLMEEVKELEEEIFFGEKRAAMEYKDDLNRDWAREQTKILHKSRIRTEDTSGCNGYQNCAGVNKVILK